ncbi:MAG: hypothetical protein ACTHK7_15520 [Aureliella sp.]
MPFIKFFYGAATDPNMSGANLGLLISYAMAGALLYGVMRGQSRKQREPQREPDGEEREDPAAEFEMHSVINTVGD